MLSEKLVLEGHILDSLTLSKVLDIILKDGGTYEVEDVEVGSSRSEASHVSIHVSAPDEVTMSRIIEDCRPHGAVRSGA